MVKHNNMIPGEHLRKHWQSNAKTGFNRKTRRRIARRPSSGPLRRVVHGQTFKYRMKVRDGRAFTLEELKAAEISKKVAPSIGIAVDHRRKNRSFQGLQAKVQLLRTYKKQLVV